MTTIAYRTRIAVLFAALAMPTFAQDPLTKQALGRIEEIEKLEPTIAAGDRRAASLAINNLDWAGKRLNAVRDRNEPTWKSAEQRYKALRTKLEAKANAAAGGAAPAAGVDAAKLAQLDKDVRAAHHNFKIVPANLLTDESRTTSITRDLAKLRERLAEFPAGDPAVKAVAGNLATFQTEFDAAMTKLRGDAGEQGAISARLAELDKKYQQQSMPQELAAPFEEAQLRAFLAGLRRWRDVELTADLEFLAGARNNTTVDRQHVDRLYHWLQQGWVARTDELARNMQQRLDAAVQAGQQAAEFILATDANDRDQVANRILGKGRFDENMARLRDGAQAVALRKVFAEVMGTDLPAEHAARGTLVDQAVVHLRKLAVATLDAVRMPKAASTDAELTRIAEETLRKKEYGVNAWQRLVINADKVRKESREAYVSPGAAYTTVTYYHYVWDEYQVATAEQVGDEVWCSSTSSSSTTPATPPSRSAAGC